MFYIYRITNLINGKTYVGAHSGRHDDGYMGSGRGVQEAIRKYGRENFAKEVVCECATQEELYAREQELVTPEFVARRDTYNAKVGGIGAPKGNTYRLGKPAPFKHRRPRTEAERQAISLALQGRKHTPERIEKQRASLRENWAARMRG